ncbi:MAG: arginine deiminase family protein, partial [Nitriliruptoraceae bacterium]
MTRRDAGGPLRLAPGAHPRPDPPSVRSEVGELTTVLVHRPGEELRRVTPSNMEQLLFDELLWVEHAQAEHDAFTDLLRAQGVEVLVLTDLLAEVVADPEAARALV